MLTGVVHLRFCETWQGWSWQAWMLQRRLVIGVQSAVRHSAPARHYDPACHCCYAHDRDACLYLCLRLLLRRHFGHHDLCGAHSPLPHHYPLPRALTLSPCPLAEKQGFALFFFDESSLKGHRCLNVKEAIVQVLLTSKLNMTQTLNWCKWIPILNGQGVITSHKNPGSVSNLQSLHFCHSFGVAAQHRHVLRCPLRRHWPWPLDHSLWSNPKKTNQSKIFLNSN